MHHKCSVLSSLSCFCTFLKPIPKWNKFYKNLLLVSVPLGGFLNHLRNRKQTCLLCWEWTLLALGQIFFGAGDERICAGDKHFGAGDEYVENARSNFSHTHTHTQVASCQRLPNCTHRYSPLKTGSITFSYSPPKTSSISLLYSPSSVLHISALALSAGLTCLQVDQVDRENNKQNFTYTQLVPCKLVAACVMHAFSNPCVAWLYMPRPHK